MFSLKEEVARVVINSMKYDRGHCGKSKRLSKQVWEFARIVEKTLTIIIVIHEFVRADKYFAVMSSWL